MTAARLAAVAAVLLLAAAAPAHAAGQPVVSVDPTAVETRLGEAFVVRSTIENPGAAPAAGLVAHLNVLSLDGDVYVDPEDWSSDRTRYLAPIPAGGSTTLTWTLKAVNAGRLGVFVAVLPRDGAAAPVASQTVRVTIAKRRTLNSGGILPLALGIPALLGLLTVSVRVRRRRLRAGA